MSLLSSRYPVMPHFCHTNVVNSHDYIQGTKSALRESKYDLTEINPSISQSSFFLQHIVVAVVVERIPQKATLSARRISSAHACTKLLYFPFDFPQFVRTGRKGV